MYDYETLVRDQAKRYPHLQPEDACKAVFQAVLGPGHLVVSEQAAIERIRTELTTTLPKTSNSMIEPIGDRFCRAHLGAIKCSGLSVDTFARLFMRSTQVETGGKREIEAGTTAIIDLADRGELPFSGDEAREYIDKWREGGYRAISHSKKFHQHYAPAYRTVARPVAAIMPMLCRIDSRIRDGGRVVVAIDGMCGSGKTTLANELAAIFDCAVFHADDYFLRAEQRTNSRLSEPGGNLDRERMIEELLIPIANGATSVTHRKFDCSDMTLGEPVTTEVGDVVIIEGSYTMHPEMMQYYTDTVFIHIDSGFQRERIVARDGEEGSKAFFDKWIPMENLYIVDTQANRRCEFLLEAKDLAVNYK